MRTFFRFLGTSMAVALLATAAQAGGGVVMTPNTARLGDGLSPNLKSTLVRFYSCIVELKAGHAKDCMPEWRDAFEGLVSEGKTPALAKLTLLQIAIEVGGYEVRDQVAKYGDAQVAAPTAARPSR